MASVEEDAGTGVEIRLEVEDDEDGAARGYEATLDMHTGEHTRQHVATMHDVRPEMGGIRPSVTTSGRGVTLIRRGRRPAHASADQQRIAFTRLFAK